MPPPDWQLPAGVDRHLWDYLHSPELAHGYDAGLAGSPLVRHDLAFAEEYFTHPGRLVDLGCGTGRLCLHFARRGFWTLGLDLSAEMLRVLGDKATRQGLPIPRLQANLVELGCLDDATFDCAACLFSTLGMIAGEANRRQALAHVFRLLKPGGRLVLHVHNRWHNLWTPGARGWLVRDTVQSLLTGRPAGDCPMPAHQGLAGLTLHLFARREIVRLVRSVGFRLLEVRPLRSTGDGRLRCPWWLGGLRAQGWLLAAEKAR